MAERQVREWPFPDSDPQHAPGRRQGRGEGGRRRGACEAPGAYPSLRGAATPAAAWGGFRRAGVSPGVPLASQGELASPSFRTMKARAPRGVFVGRKHCWQSAQRRGLRRPGCQARRRREIRSAVGEARGARAGLKRTGAAARVATPQRHPKCPWLGRAAFDLGLVMRQPVDVGTLGAVRMF